MVTENERERYGSHEKDLEHKMMLKGRLEDSPSRRSTKWPTIGFDDEDENGGPVILLRR